MSHARVRIFLARSIALGVIPLACHRQSPAQRQPEVRREVKDTTRNVAIRDPSVAALFRDTTTGLYSARGRTFRLQTAADRKSLRAAIKKERELWRSVKPSDYRFLLRVGCFCPGTRGWQLMEVRGGMLLRAWDTTGRAATLTDWNTLSIDGLYDNLELVADRNLEVQIAFDPRWHFPVYVRGSGSRMPDTWSIIEAQALRPIR